MGRLYSKLGQQLEDCFENFAVIYLLEGSVVRSEEIGDKFPNAEKTITIVKNERFGGRITFSIREEKFSFFDAIVLIRSKILIGLPDKELKSLFKKAGIISWARKDQGYGYLFETEIKCKVYNVEQLQLLLETIGSYVYEEEKFNV